MLLPAKASSHGTLVARQESGGRNVTTVTIVVVTIAIVCSVAFLSYIGLKSIRVRQDNPRYIPTEYLKNKWRNWRPTGLTGSKGSYSSRLQEDTSYAPTLHNRSARESAQLADVDVSGANGNLSGGTVERNTSVRSVMTLPAYSKSVRDNERVLGREGERGGIDTVVEASETAEEEEARREEEMESLYQIREQRRREVAEREQRREARRAARQRQDYEALAAMRQESIWRREQRAVQGAAAMIAEHRANSRERRVSSVSYADLGVARHDGTRLRANSTDSDNRPLLDSAASMSESTVRPATGGSLSVDRRGRSGSSASAMTGSDVSDNEMDLPPFGRSGNDFEVVSMSRTHSRDLSATQHSIDNRSRTNIGAAPLTLDTADVGDSRIPMYQPPSYDEGFEEAPPYTSPVDRQQIPGFLQSRSQQSATPRPTSSTGAPLLPEIGRLPSIRIAEATPIEPRGPTPDFPATVAEGNEGRER